MAAPLVASDAMKLAAEAQRFQQWMDNTLSHADQPLMHQCVADQRTWFEQLDEAERKLIFRSTGSGNNGIVRKLSYNSRYIGWAANEGLKKRLERSVEFGLALYRTQIALIMTKNTARTRARAALDARSSNCFYASCGLSSGQHIWNMFSAVSQSGLNMRSAVHCGGLSVPGCICIFAKDLESPCGNRISLSLLPSRFENTSRACPL